MDDDQLTLAGKQDVSRLTLTLGKMSVKDIFDNNAYANDPRTQFMSWSFMQPSDRERGIIRRDAAKARLCHLVSRPELNQPVWTLSVTDFSRMPRVSNGNRGA